MLTKIRIPENQSCKEIHAGNLDCNRAQHRHTYRYIYTTHLSLP